MKQFQVSADWIDYAHGPGAESGQPLATTLVNLPGRTVKISDPALVREIVSVAELYTGCRDDDPTISRRAASIIKRARAWLREQSNVE